MMTMGFVEARSEIRRTAPFLGSSWLGDTLDYAGHWQMLSLWYNAFSIDDAKRPCRFLAHPPKGEDHEPASHP